MKLNNSQEANNIMQKSTWKLFANTQIPHLTFILQHVKSK